MLFNISTQSIASQSTVTYIPQYSSHDLLIGGEDDVFSKCGPYGTYAYEYNRQGPDTEDDDTTDGKPAISSFYEYDDQVALGEEAATRYSDGIAPKKADVMCSAKKTATFRQRSDEVTLGDCDNEKSVRFIGLHIPISPPANGSRARTSITELIRSMTKFAPAATAFS